MDEDVEMLENNEMGFVSEVATGAPMNILKHKRQQAAVNARIQEADKAMSITGGSFSF